ncbi:hypothetical protein [Aeromonas phage 85AhydR10PP]|nr:hypothetical protein [Aeromonas phage 13AhydR10PP]AWH14996.1 hypothetical protein [Aeromonas phage 85AhydR10PP]AWH15378.1 hypothetical protein [Aeromonas phage 14AhydR10PP]
MSYIKACVLICKRKPFQLYLMHRTCRLVTTEEEALKAVRLLTGIRSRKELTRCPNAAMEWQALITDFNKWNTKQ